MQLADDNRDSGCLERQALPTPDRQGHDMEMGGTAGRKEQLK